MRLILHISVFPKWEYGGKVQLIADEQKEYGKVKYKPSLYCILIYVNINITYTGIPECVLVLPIVLAT